MDDDAELTLVDEEENSNLQIDETLNDVALELELDSNEPATIELQSEELTSESNQSEPLACVKKEPEMAEITKTTKKQKGKGGTALDKFKRRLIRALSRLIIKQEEPTEEIWEELKKQTGCDCNLLWNRMRALAIKKLRRLFSAGDVVANVTRIAQLNVTDWLLFDLVLVHEKIDVIGQDIETEIEANKESPQILEDLFCTVVLFNIERLQGDELTKAWFEATKYYNNSFYSVRQCSPMLLQRRWYQLKESVREKFYQFWFSYRGTQRQLAAANDFKPTALEMEIIKEFRYIATSPFPTWESLIQQKKVALPEDFERLQLAKGKIFRSEKESSEPDLEVIEPQVETIDLELETDSEGSRDSSSLRETIEGGKTKNNAVTRDESIPESKTDVNLGLVKTEIVDEISDEDDVRVLESEYLPSEINNKEGESRLAETGKSDDDDHISVIDDSDSSANCKELASFAPSENENADSSKKNIDNAEPQDNYNSGDNITSQDDIEIVIPAMSASTLTIPNTSNDIEIVMPKITSVTGASLLSNESVVDDSVDNEINGILKNVAENISTNQLFKGPILNSQKILPASDNIEHTDTLVKKIIDEEINSKSTEIEEKKTESKDAVTNDYIFDGIELEDDGIEYIEEEDHMKDMKVTEVNVEKNDDSSNTPTIDLKLLLTPVVYTKKLDDMDVFRFIEYDAVKDKRVIENADGESKPVDRNSVKMEEISQERQPTPDSDAFNDSASEYNSEDEYGPESVSVSSWLLNKPRNLRYNPIQLCKNPDFNTRLKRLTAGFYASVRNRLLLKECKPLTIDLHKAFESKLVNNTLYLKETDIIENTKIVLENTIDKSVFPTALPIQSLINNVVNDILGPTSSPISAVKQPSTGPVSTDSHPSERKKVINLPDIAEVRRLNERLLTAEVTPIQVSNINKPPVNIVSMQHNTSQNNQILVNTTPSDITETTESTMSPTWINDNNSIATAVTTNIVNNMSSGMSTGVGNKSEDASNTNLSSNDNHINTYAHKKYSFNTLNNIISVAKGKFNNQQKGLKEHKKYARPHVEITWNPPPAKLKIPEDRLLASDTIDKIISVCQGEEWPKSKKWLQRLNKKKMSKGRNDKIPEVNQNKISEVSNDNEVSFVSEETPVENEYKNTQTNTTQKQTSNVKKKGRPRIEKRQKTITKKEKVKFCCWARERIESFETKLKCHAHRCPRPLCNCCCRQDLIQEMFKSAERRKKTLQAQSEPIPTEKKSEQITNASTKLPLKINISPGNKYHTQMSSKVSVGINTDYDKDFENTFAISLAKMNSKTTNNNHENELASSSQDIYALDNNSVFRQTQTTVNIMNCKNTSKNLPPLMPMKTKIYSRNDALFQKLPNIAPKRQISKTQVNTSDVQLSSNLVLQDRGDKPDKVLFLTNDKMKHTYSQSPICLGKNKILLCSFERPQSANLSVNNESNQPAQPQLTLPDGVRIVLLPNKELALSIDPGVELDSSQLAYLPAVMASVQQQLANETVNDLIEPNIDGAKNVTVSNDQNNTIDKSDESENKDITKKINDENSDNVTLLTEVDSCNNEQLIHKTDDNTDANKIKEADKFASDNSNTNVDDSKDNPALSKKTILSDLMEMSGISAEDTCITNNESPTKQQALFPTSQELQTKYPTQSNERLLNDPLFKNPVVQTALNRCPELCIVYSYQQLKYASENNAQFFKMDIETGVVVPINLLIKKQVQTTKSKQLTMSKSVIDLTDEPEDDEESSIINTEKQNAVSFSIEPVSQTEEARPVKLFSTIHPSSLRGGKSLLLRSITSGRKILPNTNKKVIRIVKVQAKRKSTTCLTSIDLDSDNELKETDPSPNSNDEKLPENTTCNSDSDSDDEPLALKAKRIKKPTETVDENHAETEKLDNENNDTEMVSETISDNPSLDIPKNIPEEVYMNSTPRLEPVVFEPLNYGDNNPESSDEDCILGV